MRFRILTFLALALVCLAFVGAASAAKYQEITVSPTGSLEIPLDKVYSHIQISSPATIAARFVTPVYNSAGEQISFQLNPAGGTGTYPAPGDTTMTVFIDTESLWNIYNHIDAKKILLTGTATGVIIRMLE